MVDQKRVGLVSSLRFLLVGFNGFWLKYCDEFRLFENENARFLINHSTYLLNSWMILPYFLL